MFSTIFCFCCWLAFVICENVVDVDVDDDEDADDEEEEAKQVDQADDVCASESSRQCSWTRVVCSWVPDRSCADA